MNRLFISSILRLLALVQFTVTVCFSYAQTITTFDPPNSTYTYASAINAAGQITGYFVDANGQHGFLREPTGKIAVFDIPMDEYCLGEGTSAPSAVAPQAINPAGVITGDYSEGTLYCLSRRRGFVRDRDGTITRFDVPAFPGGPPAVYVHPVTINPAGTIAGFFLAFDVPGPYFGFLRQRDGAIIIIDASELVYPVAKAINPRGQITGYYLDMSGIHGFLRDPDGTISTFDAGGTFSATYPTAITPAGEIIGNVYSGLRNQGFLRRPDGSIITFDASANVTYTMPTAMNQQGQITGYYRDANNAYHGFLRHRDGIITVMDLPNSTFMTPTAINSKGEVTGSYANSGGVHGFLLNW